MGSGVEQWPESVGALRTLAPIRLSRPVFIIDRVIGLHRSDDVVSGEGSDLLQPQMLGVFDSKPPVAFSVSRRHLREHVQDRPIRPVAGCVNGYLATGGVRAHDVIEHLGFGDHVVCRKTGRPRLIQVGREEKRWTYRMAAFSAMAIWSDVGGIRL